MRVVWRAGKEKREGQIEKEKRERKTKIKAPVALAGLKVTEAVVEGLEEVTTGAGRRKKVATGVEGLRKAATRVERPGKAALAGAEGPASLSSPTSLLLMVFMLSLTSLVSRQALFLAFDKCFLHIFSLFSLLFFS